MVTEGKEKLRHAVHGLVCIEAASMANLAKQGVGLMHLGLKTSRPALLAVCRTSTRLKRAVPRRCLRCWRGQTQESEIVETS
jgi:hypothetical protein